MLRTLISASPYSVSVGAVFAYLFRRINRQGLKTHLGSEFDKAKPALSSGYVLKNCKLYAYAVFRDRTARASKFGVSQEDAPILRRLNLYHVPSKHKVYSLQEMDNLLAMAILNPAMDAYISKFIYRKMRFLTASFGVPKEDIASDLQAAAVYALYKQYPFYHTEAHAVNICKTAIHNTGIGLIQYHTRQSRQRLLKEGDAFQAVNSDVALHHSLEAYQPYKNDIRDSLQSLVQLAPRMSPRVVEFLSTAAGIYNENFSAYLKKNNSEAANSMNYDAYLKKVQAFFGVSEESAQKLFQKLRPHL